jgi:hypothetical protein
MHLLFFPVSNQGLSVLDFFGLMGVFASTWQIVIE